MPVCVGNTTLITAKDGLPGTNGYRPPEYADCKYSTKSDIYFFGVVSFLKFLSVKLLQRHIITIHAI